MESMRSGGSGVPSFASAASPARTVCHFGRKPAPSRIFTTAPVISTPIPSPGIKVTTEPSRALDLLVFKISLQVYFDANGSSGVDILEVLYHAPNRVAHHSFRETLTLVERDRSPIDCKLYQVPF